MNPLLPSTLQKEIFMQRHRIGLACLGLACLGFALMLATTAASAQYRLTNLSSNQVKAARHDDPLLVNAWGLVHAPGSPWWVSDNNSGWATLYDADGNLIQQLKVLIPTAGENGPGSPTGVVANGSKEFQVQGWPSIFLFATLDGTISGWAPQSNFNDAIVAVNNSSQGAVYTGLAITSNPSGNRIYAADMAHNEVAVFDGNFNPLTPITNPLVPAGFAPFGIRDIGGMVYVTYANVAGGDGGFVDVFHEDGTPVTPGKHLLQGAPLNQPWGIAVAPANFGPLSNTLLISNNVNSGTINAFNPSSTHPFVGHVRDENGIPIFIDQLWGIDFGDGAKGGKNGNPNQLFFTAGPANNVAGTFGLIAFKTQ
jgi:uncharacterized protein (TIGR03118 family)